MSIEVVSKLLGHSSVTTTSAIYGHLTAEDAREGAGEGRLADRAGGDLVTGGRAGRREAPGPVPRPGLLAALLAAVRPEFRGEVIPVDPADPVFGGPPCQVDGCTRAARLRGICTGHYQRWATKAACRSGTSSRRRTRPCTGTGRCRPATSPDAVTAASGQGLCGAHHSAWTRAGRPALPAWLGTLPARPRAPPAAPCLVPSCALLAEGRDPFCLSHRSRWRHAGKPDPGEFAAACDDHLPRSERIDLRRLGGQLRLEVQYALQRRRDEARLRTAPGHVSKFVGALARSGVSSVLDWAEEEWRTVPPLTPRSASQARALVVHARREVENLCYGTGWEVEYPRDTWRLRNLGITTVRVAHVRFGGIPQDWLRDLAKRNARWQLAAGPAARARSPAAPGLSPGSASSSPAPGPPEPDAVTPGGPGALPGRPGRPARHPAPPRHRQDQHVPPGRPPARLGRDAPGRRHDLPRGLPARPVLLPRALAEHIMAQVEDPATLARCADPASGW